ncbi:unnamed protein product [Fraxinus pennsylvanica]|uniref:Uncharacterized protein n=1 Tax=Fraxinus pennsylvanica TaxID=56036 RepID=A0AAD1Z8Y2_9LAMI|nr:unnamed protein product [Fraxinus pennsylvanica]
MDFLLLKKISLLFLLISASLMSISFAGRHVSSHSFMDQKRASVTHEEHHGKMSEVHERLLRVNNKDYGRIDPPPELCANRSVSKLDQKRASVTHEEHHGKMSEVHERLLRVNNKDYGRIDPSPELGFQIDGPRDLILQCTFS